MARVDRLNMETKYLLQNYFSADSGMPCGINAPVTIHLIAKAQKHRMLKFGNGLRHMECHGAILSGK